MEIYGSGGEEMNKIPISVIILTYKEEKNIEECLKSVYQWADEIFILDFYSTDKALEIVRKYTDKIYQHPFETQATQFNWALDNLPITTDWILRLDADERVTPELRDELIRKLPTLSKGITALYVRRRVYFMGRWIKHGGYYPTWLLRLWRKRKARYEERAMDEHVILSEGKTLRLKHDIIDWNHKGLSFWVEKHNQFASREMQAILATYNDQLELNVSYLAPSVVGTQEQRKRWLKERVYLRMPLFFRSFLYFLYRYFFRLDFLDGKEGLIFHFLQCFWYRFLVTQLFTIPQRKPMYWQ